MGRAVGRDVGGGDPERMAPPRVAEYVQELFKSSCVTVNNQVFSSYIDLMNINDYYRQK